MKSERAEGYMKRDDRLLTLLEVMGRTGLARPTIYKWAALGTFPKPCKCGRASRWSEQEIVDWIAARLDSRH